MSLTTNERALLAALEKEPLSVRNDITEAATAARRHLMDAGHHVTFDDRHAALDAAIYRYMLESRAARQEPDEAAHFRAL